jgi:hypothetical protein
VKEQQTIFLNYYKIKINCNPIKNVHQIDIFNNFLIRNRDFNNLLSYLLETILIKNQVIHFSIINLIFS